MTTLKYGALAVATIVAGLAWGSVAQAGKTKLLANVGPVEGADGIGISTKSKFIIDSKGNVKVLLKRLCVATAFSGLPGETGMPVCDVDAKGKPVKYNGEGIVTFDPTKDPSLDDLDGNEVIAVAEGDFMSSPDLDPGTPNLPTETQIIVACEIKKGNANRGCKVDLSELLELQSLLGSGEPGLLEVKSVNFYGPVGAASETCEAAMDVLGGGFAVLNDAIAVINPPLAFVPVGDPAHPCVPDASNRIGTIGIGIGE